MDFQRKNQTVFKSVNFAGYVGVLTGMKPQHFTITLDERFSLDGGFVGIIRWLMGDRSAKWAGFLMRDILDETSTYQQALTILTTSKLLAPVYFILSGNSSGQVSSHVCYHLLRKTYFRLAPLNNEYSTN